MSNQIDRRTLHTASTCVAGDHDPALGMVMPIHTSSAFYFLQDGPQPYPRYFNTPNHDAVSKRIAELEHAEEGMVFCSGMAAISTCVMAMVSPGDHVLLLNGLYGGSHSFLIHEFQKWGIEFDFVSADIDEFKAKCRSNTVIAYVESPTNPCLEILDLTSLAAFAKEANILTIIDNTFASPINQNPIDFGIDLVVHSGTKYLGGHSDLSSGAVVGRSDLMGKVMRQARMYGGNLNAQSCHLLERSIKTLDVRVRRQNENAMAVAEFLNAQEPVNRVLYPGLKSHSGHELAAKQMSGFGGMVSFELKPECCLKTFLNSLKLITPAMSLGGVESTVTIPVYTSHKEMSEQGRIECGVTPGLIRFSIGIENADDLIADLTTAIHKAAQSV